MATADKSGIPLVVPICYVFSQERIFTPIDKKPKRVSAGDLKRVRNIRENPRVSVVIDDYSEDWSRLCYVIIRGRAELIESGKEYEGSLTLLCEKYAQYREMGLSGLGLPVIKISSERIVSWGLPPKEQI